MQLDSGDIRKAEGGAEENQLFRTLVEQHSTRLFRFIIKHIGNTTEAEELTQQAFVEAVRSYRSFRGESQLSTWLYGIALNLVRNHLSRAPERRYEFMGDASLDLQEAPGPSPQEALEQRQAVRALSDALDELPEHMRELLMLVGLNDISYEEAAVLLSVPVGTVRSRLSRARSALRDRMQAKGL